MQQFYSEKKMCEIIRQSRAYEILRRDVLSEKLSHAYLFNGRPSVTDVLFKLFAATIFCENRKTSGYGNGFHSFEGENLGSSNAYGANDLTASNNSTALSNDNRIPCCECASCRRVFENRHSNILIYPLLDKYKVSDAESIEEQAYIKPLEYGEKIFLLKNAEKLSAIVQNKLLKIIEEPPLGVHFVFLSQGTQTLLPTVVSRLKPIITPTLTFNQTLLVIGGNSENENQNASSKSNQASNSKTYQASNQNQKRIKAAAVLCNGDLELCEKYLTDRGFAIFEFCLECALRLKNAADFAFYSTGANKFKDRAGELLDCFSLIFSEAQQSMQTGGTVLPYEMEITRIANDFSVISLFNIQTQINICRERQQFYCNFTFVTDSLLLKIISERKLSGKKKTEV